MATVVDWRMNPKKMFTVALGFLLLSGLEGCGHRGPPFDVDGDRLAWWREARFGMFLHWGPVSLKGTEIGWSRGVQVPEVEYDRLYEDFNPSRFDAGEWVQIARDAGMKYIVITSKHHDGFCLWDSRFTEYDIANSPFKRDVIRELSDACLRGGLAFGTYYSICDWYNPDYPTGSPGGRSEKPDPDMAGYLVYLHGQVRELSENYGPLLCFWFDGQWEAPWTFEYGEGLTRLCRELDPGVLINNRVGKDRQGMGGTTGQDSRNPGDFDTPEQRIGTFDRDRPWETCMTIGRQWAWKPEDDLKSVRECIRTLVRVVGGDGNLLLNVGPMPDGRIEPRQVDILRGIGLWLDEYGTSIYGTRGGPFEPGLWGASTCRGSTIYLHVLDWLDVPLTLPPVDAVIKDARILGGGSVSFTQTEDGVVLEVPERDRDPVDTVIVLRTDRDALDIPTLSVGTGSISEGKPARASNVFRGMTEYGPDRAFDGDPGTRWATDAGTRRAWVEVDLGEQEVLNRSLINEAYPGRVVRFELQRWVDGQWRPFHSGGRIGERLILDFEPVTAQRVRLAILEASEGPTIWEWMLFGPGSGNQ